MAKLADTAVQTRRLIGNMAMLGSQPLTTQPQSQHQPYEHPLWQVPVSTGQEWGQQAHNEMIYCYPSPWKANGGVQSSSEKFTAGCCLHAWRLRSTRNVACSDDSHWNRAPSLLACLSRVEQIGHAIYLQPCYRAPRRRPICSYDSTTLPRSWRKRSLSSFSRVSISQTRQPSGVNSSPKVTSPSIRPNSSL